MKPLRPHTSNVISSILVAILFSSVWSGTAQAQTNIWTNSVSAYWEDSGWSLGSLPALNETILFTNAGWKALAIGASTTLGFPQSLNIGSLAVSSPTNSFNELLLNYAGVQTPLVIGGAGEQGSLVIASNSAVDMLSSALIVENAAESGPNPAGAFSVGGSFIETDGSQVTASFLHVGDIGPAVYDLTNSTLSVEDLEYVGGGFPATFNQQGGTNATTDLVLQAGGEYDLYDGYFGGGIEFQGGNFNQWGGNVSANLEYQFWLGTYHLAAGVLSSGDLAIPGTPPQNLPQSAGGLLWQTGGTNFAGAILLGNNYGTGSYNLSNGVLIATGLSIGYFETPQSSIYGCVFNQSGGFHTNGGIGIYGSYNRDFIVSPAYYNLSGGALQTPSISLNMSVFTQSGGTNEAGDISLNDVSSYELSGGRLSVQTIELNGGDLYGQTGAFTQSGGVCQVGNLSLNNSSSYTFAGGQMTAQAMQVSDSSVFHHLGGALSPGLLTLANGTWDERVGGPPFGQLQLGAGSNSAILLPTNACVLQFADSSGLAWSNNAALAIENWNGSLWGGGGQQIIFGHSAAALTAQQTGQIQFHNPAALSAANYPARILASGEIVPDTGSPMLGISAGSGGGPQLTLQGKIGQTYEIDVSTDLVHWVALTNQLNVSGAISLTDAAATNCPLRFYRAILSP